jgi:uncharacterized membrane protein HdeD (DUF308 family)
MPVDEPRHHRGWLIGLGIGLAALGALAIAASVATTIGSVVFVGTLLLVGGIAEILHAFSVPRGSGVVLSLLGGVLYVVVGGLMLTRPVESAVTLTLLLASFFMVAGLFRIVAVPVLQLSNWGWVLASGIVSFVLGAAIWAQWPVSGLWVIGAYVGVEMLVYGLSLLMLGLAVRDIGQAVERRRAA